MAVFTGTSRIKDHGICVRGTTHNSFSQNLKVWKKSSSPEIEAKKALWKYQAKKNRLKV